MGGIFLIIAVFLQALNFARVAELVDALDLGSSAVRRGGSSPFTRTKLSKRFRLLFCCEILFNCQINKCIFATLLKQ